MTLTRGESWTIIGLLSVPLEFQPKMKNRSWIYRHSTRFINYTSDLTNSVIVGSSRCSTKLLSLTIFYLPIKYQNGLDTS